MSSWHLHFQSKFFDLSCAQGEVEDDTGDRLIAITLSSSVATVTSARVSSVPSARTPACAAASWRPRARRAPAIAPRSDGCGASGMTRSRRSRRCARCWRRSPPRPDRGASPPIGGADPVAWRPRERVSCVSPRPGLSPKRATRRAQKGPGGLHRPGPSYERWRTVRSPSRRPCRRHPRRRPSRASARPRRARRS